MAQVITNINLSNAQKKVLISVHSAPTPKVAAEDISTDKKMVVARDQMVDLKMIDYAPGSATLTSAGEQLMKDESLIDDMGELTDEANALMPNEQPPMESTMGLLGKINDLTKLNESAQFTPAEMKMIIAIENGKVDLDMGSDLYDKLFNYFADEMPYGIQKAREGDPDQWIIDHLHELTAKFKK